MLSLVQFLANIRPHFDQLRSDARAVVCMDKSRLAIKAKFGKAVSQFHKLRHSVMRAIRTFSDPFSSIKANLFVALSINDLKSTVTIRAWNHRIPRVCYGEEARLTKVWAFTGTLV